MKAGYKHTPFLEAMAAESIAAERDDAMRRLAKCKKKLAETQLLLKNSRAKSRRLQERINESGTLPSCMTVYGIQM